jgi:hypothetical protein
VDDIGAAVLLAQRILERAGVEHQHVLAPGGIGKLEEIGGRHIGHDEMGTARSQPIDRRRGVLAGFQRHILQKKALVEEAAGGVVVVDGNLDPGEAEIGRGLVEHREGDAALLGGMNIGDADLLEVGGDA